MTYPESLNDKSELYVKAVQAMAGAIGARTRRPLLFDYNGQPIRASYHQIERSGAKRSGSMKNWIPRRIFSDQQASREREDLIDRAIDLSNNDPHAAGVVDTIATTTIGSGLLPYPNFTPEEIGYQKSQKEEVNSIKRALRRVVKRWAPFADAGERLSFGALQFLAMSNIVGMGECLFLLPMLKDPIRPYSLAMQCISPLRLKTPNDKRNNKKIRDGIEIGAYGQPVAYWIKKGESRKGELPDISKHFSRIPARVGHRVNVIHIFYSTSPEQIRGVPWFSPAIKFFRDLNDYLDAELVSNIVTAAFSLFIEVSEMEPDYPAANFADITETGYTSDGTQKQTRYEELIPGLIRYGNAGEKPHVISAQRPGATFEPFVTVIEKAISAAVGIPHPVLFKDFKGMNFASYRSAMLEAWRFFKSRRQWFGAGFCAPAYSMLAEEAWLRGEVPVKKFYSKRLEITSADWIGPPKGQIEPIKEIQADEKANKLRVKTLRKIAMEQGSEDIEDVIEQIDEEEAELERRGLKIEQTQGAEQASSEQDGSGDSSDARREND